MTSHTQYAVEAVESVDGAQTNTAAAVHAGLGLAGPRQLVSNGERFFTQLVPAGSELVTIDVDDLEQALAARPRRKTGTVHVHTAEAFIDYLGKHGIPETEVWADLTRQNLVGVINAHQEAESSEDAVNADLGAGHGDHRIHLELLQTDPWKAWVGNNKKWMTQVDFANHIEDNAIDVVNPDSATMLEIAQSFHATTNADFKSGHRLHSSEVTLRYEETTAARAGHTADIEIPTAFDLELAPFDGSKLYVVQARFRYRISGGNLHLSYHLVRPEDVLKQAFIDYVDAVSNEVTSPVFRGRPE